ncbi:MAG: hypothetical protein M1396_02515 [Chloroflexi bacterium]|nr:hypothetical protein [Chloroflexota bacterium]
MNIWLALLLVWSLTALACYNAWQLWRWSPRPVQRATVATTDEPARCVTRAA